MRFEDLWSYGVFQSVLFQLKKWGRYRQVLGGKLLILNSEDANVNFGRPDAWICTKNFSDGRRRGHLPQDWKTGELYKVRTLLRLRKRKWLQNFWFLRQPVYRQSFGENIEAIGRHLVLPQEYVQFMLPVLRSGIILGQIVKNRMNRIRHLWRQKAETSVFQKWIWCKQEIVLRFFTAKKLPLTIILKDTLPSA